MIDLVRKDPGGIVDFIVEVEENRDITILQITDPQIIDGAQSRRGNGVGPYDIARSEQYCYSYLRKVIEATKPDLIILTGDMVYGEFDDAGTVLLSFIEFMEGFNIPWAPVFGNHDNESRKGVDWQCRQLEAARNCLFLQRTLTGNGNYTVGIKQGGRIKRVFFMMDSNGCQFMSDESFANGHSKREYCFADDQIDWYTRAAEQIKESDPGTKLSFAFHIAPIVFSDAFTKYGFTNVDTWANPIDIDALDDADPEDFGFIGTDFFRVWDSEYRVWNSFKRLGVDSVLVGHEHLNSASVVYEGVRCHFGLKSSLYDRYNARTPDGRVVVSAALPEDPSFIPLLGGSVFMLSEADGRIKDAHHIYIQ